MRLRITFSCKETIILPVDYNYLVQSFIYKNISKEMADFLHEKGYCIKGRSFKLFTFSKLLGKMKYYRDKKMFHFTSPVTLHIASPVDEFIFTFANHLLTNDNLVIGKNRLEVKDVFFDNEKTESEITVKTLSPIVVYSTLLDMQGKKYTCYFMPLEPKFNPLIEENLRKKVIAFGGTPGKKPFEIHPVGRTRQKIVTYKGFTIKGSEGIFKLKGNTELIRMALGAGLGAKNSQGFGCIVKA